jgi:hypothetical protein
MFNFEMIKEEQGNKNMKARFVLSKPLVRDDLFEVSEPQKGSEKNQSERNVVELRGDDIRLIISSDEMDEMKNEKKFWHPVPKLMIVNGSKNVHFKQFFFILENFFVNNLESDMIVLKDLSLKNKYEFRKLHIDLQEFASWLEPVPRIYNLIINDICIYYGENRVKPQPFIPFDEDILSYPFWKDSEVTHGVFILEVANLNEIMLEKFYYQSKVTIFARNYRIRRDFKKISIFSC